MHAHIFEFLKTKILFYKSLSGFIPKNLIFWLLVVYDDFHKTLEKQQLTQATFFYIFRMGKLHAIGIQDNFLDRFIKYLLGRSEAAVIKIGTSNYLTLR